MPAEEIMKQAADCKIGDSLEGWKDVVGYEGLYKVSSHGRIINQSGKIHAVCINRLGYCKLLLCNNGNRKHYLVHRVVAENFIPNPLNYPQINHKNGIKSDNNIENLEWCTSSQNNKHKYAVLKRTPNSLIIYKPVIAYNNAEELCFSSVKEACLFLKCNRLHIRNCANGKREDYRSYKWKWA